MFNELLPLILRGVHIEDCMCEGGIAQEMWQLLPEAWLHKLTKISMNRRCAMTDELPHLHRVCHRRLLGALVNCVRNGLTQSTSVLDALNKVAAAPPHNKPWPRILRATQGASNNATNKHKPYRRSSTDLPQRLLRTRDGGPGTEVATEATGGEEAGGGADSNTPTPGTPPSGKPGCNSGGAQHYPTRYTQCPP